MDRLKEQGSDAINVVQIGATPDEGGTRSSVVRIGGEKALPFLKEEGALPHPPVIALELDDRMPLEPPPALKEALGGVEKDPVAWASKAREWGADLISLRLLSSHPDQGNASVEEVVKTVESIRKACDLPMILWGCDFPEKDNVILPACSQVLARDRCLFGSATQDHYKTLAATCIADGHSIVAESPLDINICKQVNILLSEMDVPKDRIVIYPTNGALGYGFEYAYSIMERSRLAGLGGDKMMAFPMLAICGLETWRAKEARATREEMPAWGDEKERSLAWEVSAAVGYLHAGVDVVTLLNPRAIPLVRQHIEALA
jgi:acetyl-CoA decarbonylase/synthase complex subunit delta